MGMIWRLGYFVLATLYAGVGGVFAVTVSNTTTSSMTVGEAILQGLGASIVAAPSPSSSAVPSTAQITPQPSTIVHDASTTLLTGNYSLGFGNHSTVYKAQNPFEPAHWFTDGPEIASAQQCFSSLTSFELASADFYTASIQNKAWPIVTQSKSVALTIITTTTFYPSDPSTYKLCDGSPRVDIKPVTSTLNYTTSGYNYTTTLTATPTPSTPRPCDGDAALCYEWFRYSNLTNDWYTTNSTDSQLLMRQCGFPAHFAPDTDNATNWPCLLSGGPVQLYYFPVDTGDDPTQGLCNGSRTTIPHSLTTPAPTVVTDGFTLTSGSVYVSFSTLFAYYDGFGGYHFGTTFSNLILPFASSEISTGCGGYATATALNYADLNYPIPASAYSCQERCRQWANPQPPECSTIWDDFNPKMQIPSRLTDLHPAWKTCKSYDAELVQEWLIDPPIALTQHSTADGVTGPGGYVPAESTTEAVPGNNVPTRPAGVVPTWPAQTSGSASPAYDNLGSVGPSQTLSPGNIEGIGPSQTLSPGNIGSIGPSQTLDPGNGPSTSTPGQGSNSADGAEPGHPSAYSGPIAAGTWTLTASPITGTPNAVLVDGQTISEGGSALVLNGHTISYGSSGLVAVGISSSGDEEQVFTSVTSGRSPEEISQLTTSLGSATIKAPAKNTVSSGSASGTVVASATTSAAGKTIADMLTVLGIVVVMVGMMIL